MSSDLDAIARVVEAFERSDWQEIDVRSGDLRVRLSTGDGRPTSREQSSPPAATDAPTTATSSAEQPPPATDHAPSTDAPAVPAGAHVVTSPSPGIFWRAPEPGAPPFVEVGDRVDPAHTVCIVEVMKLMNHIKAGVSGQVLAVYADNGVAVAKDQPLFAVAPGSPAS
ncbi:acetyl-CoA carboxylase biotin carboxyl carrier protein [Candidatus Poriferisocius sp.]|uniref:acetyl-CoA carboxylase biotin carboxyl carrier protein n=1 Tax=Candidatus Poriferisocius sp. TaxID=3101276 RepID=UPI003B59E0C0